MSHYHTVEAMVTLWTAVFLLRSDGTMPGVRSSAVQDRELRRRVELAATRAPHSSAASCNFPSAAGESPRFKVVQRLSRGLIVQGRPKELPNRGRGQRTPHGVPTPPIDRDSGQRA